jgi:hypothetical protein
VCQDWFLPQQGCQMVYFQTKNPKLGKYGRVLQWKMMVCFICFVLRPFLCICDHSVYFVVISYALPVLVCCCKKNLATLFLSEKAYPDNVSRAVADLAGSVQ